MTVFVGYTTGDGYIGVGDPPKQPVIIKDVTARVDGVGDISVTVFYEHPVCTCEHGGEPYGGVLTNSACPLHGGEPLVEDEPEGNVPSWPGAEIR